MLSSSFLGEFMKFIGGENSVVWNPWHGCTKISEGCRNCYVYRIDARVGRSSVVLNKTADFGLPVANGRNGYKIESGSIVYTCFSSDFFHKDADEWRRAAWDMIDIRRDLEFIIITKRIDRFLVSLPDNWGDGYDHVSIGCTCENQDRADYRLPIFLNMPIKHKFIVCEPLLEKIDLAPYLCRQIEKVIVGGESGNEARVCDFDWVLSIRDNCAMSNVPFSFKQTGAVFRKGGKTYRIPRIKQFEQAKRSAIDIF